MAETTRKRNAYHVLGLHKGATPDAIKRAYVSLVKKYDPEIHTDRFMIVQNAFDRLKDPERRAHEDILTFNFLRGEYMFSKEERVDVPDAKLNQAIQMLEQKSVSEPEKAAVNNQKLMQGYLIRSAKNIARKLFKEAIDDWDRVLAIDPTHQRAKNNLLRAYSELGYSYVNHGLHDEALEVWERASQMDPENVALVQNLALASEYGGRLGEAKRYWDETIRRWKARLDRNPGDHYLKNVLIEAHRHKGDLGEAPPETASPRTAAAGTNSTSAPIEAKTQAPAGGARDSAPPPRAKTSPDEELEQCKEILKLKPDDFDANFRMGRILMGEKQWPEACKHLQSLHKKFPRNIDVLNSLGWTQLYNQEMELAFRTWRRGLKLDPKNFSIREALIKAHMLMGRTLREKGLYIGALVHFKELSKYMPDSDEVHYELAQTYKQKGEVRSAYAEYNKAIKINPKHKLARQSLSELKMRRA